MYQRLIIALWFAVLPLKAWAICSPPVTWSGNAFDRINELEAFIECNSFETTQRLKSMQEKLDGLEVELSSKQTTRRSFSNADPEINLDHIQDIWRGEAQLNRDLRALQEVNKNLRARIDNITSEIEDLRNENSELKQRIWRIE